MPNKAFIVGSGFERGITGWKARMDPVDHGASPIWSFHTVMNVDVIKHVIETGIVVGVLF